MHIDEQTRERVAIAIFKTKNGALAKWETFPQRYKDGYLLMAEAAMIALAPAAPQESQEKT